MSAETHWLAACESASVGQMDTMPTDGWTCSELMEECRRFVAIGNSALHCSASASDGAAARIPHRAARQDIWIAASDCALHTHRYELLADFLDAPRVRSTGAERGFGGVLRRLTPASLGALTSPAPRSHADRSVRRVWFQPGRAGEVRPWCGHQLRHPVCGRCPRGADRAPEARGTRVGFVGVSLIAFPSLTGFVGARRLDVVLPLTAAAGIASESVLQAASGDRRALTRRCVAATCWRDSPFT
jgi:hypothetical protein